MKVRAMGLVGQVIEDNDFIKNGVRKQNQARTKWYANQQMENSCSMCKVELLKKESTDCRDTCPIWLAHVNMVDYVLDADKMLAEYRAKMKLYAETGVIEFKDIKKQGGSL